MRKRRVGLYLTVLFYTSLVFYIRNLAVAADAGIHGVWAGKTYYGPGMATFWASFLSEFYKFFFIAVPALITIIVYVAVLWYRTRKEKNKVPAWLESLLKHNEQVDISDKLSRGESVDEDTER